jgi:hypothetical protein
VVVRPSHGWAAAVMAIVFDPGALIATTAP